MEEVHETLNAPLHVRIASSRGVSRSRAEKEQESEEAGISGVTEAARTAERHAPGTFWLPRASPEGLLRASLAVELLADCAPDVLTPPLDIVGLGPLALRDSVAVDVGDRFLGVEVRQVLGGVTV